MTTFEWWYIRPNSGKQVGPETNESMRQWCKWNDSADFQAFLTRAKWRSYKRAKDVFPAMRDAFRVHPMFPEKLPDFSEPAGE